tara:strand:+ start:15184 stop:16200 length:1017 start_codon:yes stop_codon:yes gene_type:complete
MTFNLIGHSSFIAEEFDEIVLSQDQNKKVVSGIINLDKDSNYYPSRSDEKVMRDDVKMSVVTVQKLLNDSHLSKSEIEKMSLYVANGAFIQYFQKHMSRVLRVYKELQGVMGELNRKKIYRASPPLLALETLTNSNMSFISQYGGIKGNNTTYGNTSIGAYYAIQRACKDLLNGIENSIVCASNSSGTYSQISIGSAMNSSFFKESSAGANLLFSSKKIENKKPICKITNMNHSKIVPNIYQKFVERNWSQLLEKNQSDQLIFSGAIDDETFDKDYSYLTKIHSNIFSLYPKYGSLGASSIPLGIIQGIKYVQEGSNVVDIVDRDLYGRESLIRIERC